MERGLGFMLTSLFNIYLFIQPTILQDLALERFAPVRGVARLTVFFQIPIRCREQKRGLRNQHHFHFVSGI